ncbi:MAG TPA: hypothetical protein VGA87_10310, partial [Pyrinomonadaceae bacterium]
AKAREGETPSAAYTQEAQKISGERIALAGYRLAHLLNMLFVEKAIPASAAPAASPSPKN